MQQEIANTCPICGEKNPLTNEQCYKCNFKFAEQEELYVMEKDKTSLITLLGENIEYFKAKTAFFHNLTEETDIREGKKSKKETVRRLRELLPYFNNSILFKAKTKEMLDIANITEEYKSFLKTLGVPMEELYFASNENMNYEEYRRRTLTKLGALAFALLNLKRSLEAGKICYLELKSDKEILLQILTEISLLLKTSLNNNTKGDNILSL